MSIAKILSLSKRSNKHDSTHCMKAWLDLFNHPQNFFDTVHITGTNGKGSTSIKIATTLALGGKLCGLYTSPHISSFQERIGLITTDDPGICNTQGIAIPDWSALKTPLFFIPIPTEFIASQFELMETLSIQHKIPLYFFEVTTIIAFLFFKAYRADLCVIEAGIGGRFDPTNTISPLLSIITSIGLDHSHILGKTIEEIAYEKAGIIKPNRPVIVGPTANLATIVEEAKKQQAPLFVSEPYDSFEKENQAIARKALTVLKQNPNTIEEGVKASLPCRFEVFQCSRTKRVVVLDVAHNPAAFIKLFNRWKLSFPKVKPSVICSLACDKDHEQSAKILENEVETIYLFSTDHTRLLSAEAFRNSFSSKASIEMASTFCSAFEKAIEKPSTPLIITGSFLFMDDAKRLLKLFGFHKISAAKAASSDLSVLSRKT